MVETVPDAGADLALWAASGDRAALDRALAAAGEVAHAQASRLLGRSADADDATQEALVQLVRSAKRYDPQRPFRPWLARLVHDACCRLLRSGRRRRRHESAVPPPVPASEPVDAEAVRAAVLELPESLRAVVELHYFAGLDQAEAATALGIGEGACAMRLSRARERLRALLQRRGVGVTAAVALAALTAAPANAASAGIAAGVAAQAAAGTLPATTIPLSTLQTGVWLMATHPILTATCAAGLLAALVTPFTLQAGEAPVPVPAVTIAIAPPAATAWSAPAQALLPYLDPAAPFRLALDLETLRPQMLKVKPFSLLDDPRMAAARQALPGRIEQFLGRLSAKEQFITAFWLAMAGEGRALTYAARDATSAKPVDQRMLVAMDAGPAAGRLVERFDAMLVERQQMIDAVIKAESTRLNLHLTPSPQPALPQVGPFLGKSLEGGFFSGYDGARFVFAAMPWLSERVAAAPAPPPPASAWFSFDAGPLLARYAALSGPDGDPAGIAPVLGAGWRNLKPVIDGRIATEGTGFTGSLRVTGPATGVVVVRDRVPAVITGSLRVTGAAPFSPLVPLSMLAFGTLNLPFGDCASWPMRRPTVAIPVSTDRVASLTIGLTPPPPAQPFTKAVTGRDKSGPGIERFLVLQMLAAAWSGDLALEVRPGAPLPRAALVLGLRPGSDAVEAVRQIAMWLELPQATLDQPGLLPKGVAGLTPAGQVAISAYPDRLVVTLNAEPADWPGIAAAAPAADAPACAALVDLPAATRTWGSMALALVPAEQRTLVPPLPVLIEHLPVWSMRWDATPDGCRIEERGLPLAVVLFATASIRSVLEADPEREIGRGAAPPVQPQADRVRPPATF